MPDKVPCIRCGVCCVNTCCGNWGSKRGENGLCNALIIHEEGHTSCKHITDRRSNPFGEGCVIRGFKEGFKSMKKYAEQEAGVKLSGMGGGT